MRSPRSGGVGRAGGITSTRRALGAAGDRELGDGLSDRGTRHRSAQCGDDILARVTIERCDECGFDGERWTDAQAISAVSELPTDWRQAIGGLDPVTISRRPIAQMWSIAEYTDHVRETVFGMRFILEIALADPGIDLGAPPEPVFEPEPREINIEASLTGFDHETLELCNALARLPAESWRLSVIVGGDQVDAHWMVRHALHDVTHHVGDIQHLRAALA